MVAIAPAWLVLFHRTRSYDGNVSRSVTGWAERPSFASPPMSERSRRDMNSVSIIEERRDELRRTNVQTLNVRQTTCRFVGQGQNNCRVGVLWAKSSTVCFPEYSEPLRTLASGKRVRECVQTDNIISVERYCVRYGSAQREASFLAS